jgi:TP901 family phage tail tape measure protein
MARTSATISVGADTRQLERDIQSALSRDFKFKGLNERAFTQPLGRITGAANEFQKSLDASNARVIAFGASAGLIFAVEKAFTSLVKSTIDVQKSLTDINVILNVSTNTLNQFGSSLFDIAKNTGQTFDVVAQAATELSRQGLGLEETLKRTRDALILTRLSGLDTVSAVEALTATINSFSSAALDSTTIINKLANVDAAFAVSSGDLAEAIKRVGSSASDAGVDFDELLAIVTSVQQTTARGGAVIGNSLKTIFTRIQRTDTLDQLEELGIQVRTLEGDTLPAVQILSNLSNTFSKLGDSQRAQVAETVGGVFQINILKAALADLGKEYSVYNNALKTSSSATDQAITRNEALNQTLSSLINKTFVNLTKVGADVGKISFGPTIENLLNLLNKGLENIDIDGQGIGSKIGKGILEGIGSFISGPGVILLTAVVTKLVFNLGKFAAQSLQTILNLNVKSEERAAIQAKINQVLSQETALVQSVYNKEISVLDVETKILNII